MPRIVPAGVVILAVALVQGWPAAAADPAPPAAYVVEAKDRQSVVAVLTFDVSCRNMQAAEWIVAAPVAPELPGQTGVKTTLSPAGTAVKDRSPEARPLLVARVPVTTPGRASGLPIRVTYQATLRARELKPLTAGAKAPRVPALTAADRKAYLADAGDIDLATPAFARWQAEQGYVRQPREGDLDFARRVFAAIRSGFAYEYKGEQDRRASAVCRAGRSDCGGLAVLFVAVMRTNKVPARVLYGRWAVSSKAEEKLGSGEYHQWHVKAEFYADGVGWVPVDLARAVLDKSAADPGYFGTDAGDFLTLHVDPDMVIDAGPFGAKSLVNLQRPAWWVTGRGSVTPTAVSEDWKVKPAAGKK